MDFIFNDNVRILCLSCNVKKSENLSDLSKKDRNKRHSSPFINVVKGVYIISAISWRSVLLVEEIAGFEEYQ
jgi:hypothetical protein